VDSVGGTSFVQILSKKKDYVYTTVLTIPATRLNPDGKSQILFSEAPSGNPPALHFWFPPGESRGYEFVNFPNAPIPDRSSAPAQFQLRTEGARNSPPQLEGNAADLYALREALSKIENGKFRAARDYFKRNYFLATNREGAITSFLLALLMTDRNQAAESLALVNRLDPQRARVLSQLDVNGVVESLPSARIESEGAPGPSVPAEFCARKDGRRHSADRHRRFREARREGRFVAGRDGIGQEA